MPSILAAIRVLKSLLPQQKNAAADSGPVALGYINAAHVDRRAIRQLKQSLRTHAERWGYRWGGTFVGRNRNPIPASALIRAALRNPNVALVIVPTDDHRPAGHHVLHMVRRCVPVATPHAFPTNPCPPGAWQCGWFATRRPGAAEPIDVVEHLGPEQQLRLDGPA